MSRHREPPADRSPYLLFAVLGALIALSLGGSLFYLFAGGRAQELLANSEQAAAFALPGVASAGLDSLQDLGCAHTAVGPFAELYPLASVREVIGDDPAALGVGSELRFVLCLLPSELRRIPACSEVAIHYARATGAPGPSFVLVRDEARSYCSGLYLPTGRVH